jgi:hypothetical protein
MAPDRRHDPISAGPDRARVEIRQIGDALLIAIGESVALMRRADNDPDDLWIVSVWDGVPDGEFVPTGWARIESALPIAIAALRLGRSRATNN